jgi:hypothetical protein
MDHIIDTTPQGSAILAYGKTPKTSGILKWVLIGFIGLATLVLLGAWLLVRSLSVELPGNRLLLVSLKPSRIGPAIPGGLVSDLPAAWRAAIRTDSRLPVYLGLSLDDAGEPHAFALTYRTKRIDESDALHVTPAGLMNLLEDVPSNTDRDRVRGFELLNLSRELRSHDASWVLSASELTRFVLNEGAEDADVFGTWDGNQGTIELPQTNVPSIANDGAQIVVTLGRDRTEAEPALSALASQGIDLRTVSESPSVIYLVPEHGDVRLGWETPLSSDDQRLALGALGISNSQEYQLPDETLAREIAPGEESGSSASGSLFSSKGISPIPRSEEGPSGCPGSLRLFLDGSALQNMLGSWNIPHSWRNAILSIQIRENNDQAIICINE